MATGGGSKAKEGQATANRDKKNILCDMVKSDGQYKEMIDRQEVARDAWDGRWGFMNREHILKIYEEMSSDLGLPEIFMINRRRKKTFEREYSGRQPLFSSPDVPTLTSGMVGWRSSDISHSLELVGPLYVSPTSTIDPPRRPCDLPLHQTYIHLVKLPEGFCFEDIAEGAKLTVDLCEHK